MKRVKMLQVNLQEGLLLFMETDTVIGGYSHHLQTVVLNAPWRINDIELPDALTSYVVIAGYTDFCALCYWHGNSNADVKAYQLKSWFDMKGGGK